MQSVPVRTFENRLIFDKDDWGKSRHGCFLSHGVVVPYLLLLTVGIVVVGLCSGLKLLPLRLEMFVWFTSLLQSAYKVTTTKLFA